MSTSEAELTLVMRARNLASAEFAKVHDAIDTVGTKAAAAGIKLSTLAGSLGNIAGNLASDLINGSDFGQAFANAGLMAAQVLAGTFGPALLEKLAGSAIVGTIGSALAGIGSAIGGLVAAAIPIGMAAAPYLLLAALVAAVAFLVTHPEVVGKALEVGGKILGGILSGIAGLVGGLLGVFGQAFGAVIGAAATFIGNVVGFFLSIPGKLVALGGDIVSTIIGGLVSLPGRIADVVRQAFAGLKIDVGPFHITGQGVTIDLPTIRDPNTTYDKNLNYIPHAAGGWAGLHGPELALLGERGPEYVIPNDQLRSGGAGSPSGPVQLIVDGRLLAEIVDAHQYRAGQRIPARVG